MSERSASASHTRPAGVVDGQTDMGVLLAIAVLATIPPISSAFGNFGIIRWEEVLSIAMLAIGMNVVTGYSGLLTLGPGAVFAASAYAGAYIVAHDPGLSNSAFLCVVGIVAALIVSLLTGARAAGGRLLWPWLRCSSPKSCRLSPPTRRLWGDQAGRSSSGRRPLCPADWRVSGCTRLRLRSRW